MNPSRPEGTTKEETFDIMLVAPSSNKIEIIRIGAGDNRTIEYASNKPRDVEGVSLNRPFATTIIDGASIDLTATLTPAKVTDDRVIWSIESGAELGSISFDGLNCRFTPGQTAGTVVVQVKTVQGDYAASCTITIVEEPTSVNITSDFSWTPGSITYADGVASSNYSKDWVYSNLIDVSAYNSITFSHIQTTNSTTPLGYAFYDANGEYISGASNGGVSYDTVVKAVEIPDDAKFFRVMWMNTTHSRYTEEKYEITKHFFCYGNIGDSDPEITIPTQGVSLDKSSATVFTGEGSSVSLIASIIPDNATSNEVTWSIVSGTELGSISFDGLNCTFTPGQAAGTVVIQVKTVNGEYLADCIITILNKDSSLDITKDFIWTPGSITYADGVASSNYSKDWVYSNLIDVSAYNSITFSHIQTTNSTTPLGYAFYDANGEYISGASNSGVSYDTVVKTVEIPDGAKYFRVMWMNTTHSRYTEEKYEINEHFFCYGNSNSSDTEDDGPIVLIPNEEFVYGAYFDLDSTGAMKTSGAYGNIKTSHTLLPAQNITVKVEDSDLSLYYVTIGYFDADGKYKGKSGLLKMTDGEITISASSMTSSHFRVNVYKYNGGFPKVPETATINVYGEKPVVKNWEGKTISIVGDSISAGSYPSMLGTISGAIIDNNAVSGSLLVNKGKTMISQLSEISDDADLIIVFGGTNDYWHKSVQIGELSSTDSTTFLGALDYYLSYLETNHPDAEYLFVFPADQTFGGDSSDTDFGYGTLGDFRDAFIEFCTARGVNHLDLGTSEYDCSVHSGDGVHPNTAGHQVIAEAIYEYIADISPKAK